MSLTRPSMLDTVFFRTALPCSGGYRMERRGMPLYDVVGINCKRAQLLKIKAQLSSIWAKECILMTVCVCFIWLDMTTPPLCREKVMVYYYYSAVWCSAADTHLKILDRAVSGGRFLTGGVFECDIAHRRTVAILFMLYKIRFNQMHPLNGALPRARFS